MIELHNITKSYTTKYTSLDVLRGVNLHIDKGKMVAIMGASGSGKSTLLNILGLLDTYDSGEYFIDGILMKNYSEISAARYRNAMLGFVFQNANLIAYKNIVENVALPLLYRHVPRGKRNAIAYEYLERFGLAHWSKHYPNELSGGQRQRVAIARAIVSNPKVVLADEPTGQLDSKKSVEVMDLLKKINEEQGTTMVIVTHDHNIANQCGSIIQIVDGKIV